MERETSTSRAYVYTGSGRLITESGARFPIDAGHELSRPFIASPGWLKRHAPIAEHLVPLVEWEARKAKPEPKPTPAKVAAEVEEKPKAKPKRTRKAKPKAEE